MNLKVCLVRDVKENKLCGWLRKKIEYISSGENRLLGIVDRKKKARVQRIYMKDSYYGGKMVL